MRYLIGFMCVLALGVTPLVGCTDDGGTGGSGGTAGSGGDGGTGGSVPTECTGLDDGADCKLGDTPGVCFFETCRVDDCADAGDLTSCIRFEYLEGQFPGLCSGGSCLPECEVLKDGIACTLGTETGVCTNGSCEARCENDEDCSDYNDCTVETCLSNGLCEDGGAVQDETPCAGGACQSGACVLDTSVLPCTDQGVRNAVAAGGGPYTFDCEESQTVVARAPIVIENNVILNGEGNLTINGPDEGSYDKPSVFYVNGGVTAELYGLTIVDSNFRGIINEGTLTLANSTVAGNPGGGVHNEETGTLSATSLIISDNECANDCDGAGIFNRGLLTLTASTVSGNSARGGGGGILVAGPGATTTIVNSTISGNTAAAEGGAISANGGVVTLTNCTVSGNTSLESLGSLADAQRLIMTNTAIDGDCSNTRTTSNGYNIESPGDTCGFDQSTDMPGMSAEKLKLGELADNGGPTMTHALLPDSVAIDPIPVVDCRVTEDQRGEPRPGGTMCDVGAFEVQP